MRATWFGLVAMVGMSLAGAAYAALPTVPVVMMSDIHFDPFHDPGKVTKLREAPVAEWADILNAPASADADEPFAKLQKTCKAKGVDTPWALLKNTLAEAKTREAKPLFVTVSGDLMAHQFDCRFHALAKGEDEAAYSRFAAKTVAFVAMQLRATFSGAHVYFALGNNDSGCGDYQEDEGSAFLVADGLTFADAVSEKTNSQSVLKDFSGDGDYSVVLPKPMRHTRLIVLQDIFESGRYSACAEKHAAAGAATPEQKQIQWLNAQLSAARAHHENVWLMAHIPPGVDAYSTLTHGVDVCGGAKPVTFLGDQELAHAITGYADVIKLALFGHTHMDEMRLYVAASGHAVPGKLTPSVTPVNGNLPAFVTAEIDPAKAVLSNWQTFVAKDAEGSGWSEEYDYTKAYAEPDFSAASAEKLMIGFKTDAATSRQYESVYSAGDKGPRGLALAVAWPLYTCSIVSATTEEFHDCACPAKK